MSLRLARDRFPASSMADSRNGETQLEVRCCRGLANGRILGGQARNHPHGSRRSIGRQLEWLH